MYSSTLSLTSALDGGWWSTPCPGRFTPRNDPAPVVYEAGWSQGRDWMGAENLAPSGIQSPDRPACSESLYRQTCRSSEAILSVVVGEKNVEYHYYYYCCCCCCCCYFFFFFFFLHF